MIDTDCRYEKPLVKILELFMSDMILNGSDGVIDNPGIGGPGEIEIE